MGNEQLPELLEIEYSFSSGGHNSLKLIDGRLFFFSEADSHLTEKNQYLTMVTVPESSALKVFWEDMGRLGIYGWEGKYGDVKETIKGECTHEGVHDHDNHDHHNRNNHNHHDKSNIHEKVTGDDMSSNDMSEIPHYVDIWQVKIIHGSQRVSCKSWSSEPESKDEFFDAVKKLVGIDICLSFSILSQKLSSE